MLNAGVESPLEFRRVDGSVEIDSLLIRIQEILREGNSHNSASFDREYWEWQYQRLPSGKANIYVCLCDDEIVGYYHVPIYEGVVDGESRLFGTVQDVAVSQRMRGRGVFRKLADFATADMVGSSGIDLIYTFPNSKSIHTFTKYNGYRQVASYESFVLPVSSTNVIRSRSTLFGIEKIAGFFADRYFDFRCLPLSAGDRVVSKEAFDAETAALFTKFAAQYRCHLNRSLEYLNWRYFEKPVGKHLLFVLKDGDGSVNVAAVVKLDEILGTRAAVLLDVAYNEERKLAALLHHLRDNASLFNERVDMIYASFCLPLFSKRRYGFVRVPVRLNPRPLNLLVKNISADETVVFDPHSWLAVLGDWDVL